MVHPDLLAAELQDVRDDRVRDRLREGTLWTETKERSTGAERGRAGRVGDPTATVYELQSGARVYKLISIGSGSSGSRSSGDAGLLVSCSL